MENITSFPLCVHIVLQRDEEILLLERENTSLFDGYWCLPTGKVENLETPRAAIVREVYEEIGIIVTPRLITTIAVKQPDYYNNSHIWQDISFFFFAELSKAEYNQIFNKEPSKHSKLEFYNIQALPKKIIPVVRFGIEQFIRKKTYDEFIVEEY